MPTKSQLHATEAGISDLLDTMNKVLEEVKNQNIAIGLLYSEVKAAIAEGRTDRETLSQAQAITKDDSDFYDTQTIAGIQRLSEKLNAILGLLISGRTAEASEDNVIEIRRPRQVPIIARLIGPRNRA